MICGTTRIPYKLGQKFIVKPMYDVHGLSGSCDEKQFKKDLEEYYSKGAYLIFGGDLFESIIINDPRYQRSNDKTETQLDDYLNWGEELLTPYAEKIIGIGMGNHELAVLKHHKTDLIARLCRRLDVENLGYSGLRKIIFHEEKSRSRSVVIRYHHGFGGGRTEGASLTRYWRELNAWSDASIGLYGHDHQTKIDRGDRFVMHGDNSFRSESKWLCVCGTYHKTLDKGTIPTYSEVKAYAPTHIGGISLTFKPNRQWMDIKAQLD